MRNPIYSQLITVAADLVNGHSLTDLERLTERRTITGELLQECLEILQERDRLLGVLIRGVADNLLTLENDLARAREQALEWAKFCRAQYPDINQETKP